MERDIIAAKEHALSQRERELAALAQALHHQMSEHIARQRAQDDREGALDARERNLDNRAIRLDILARRAETAREEWMLAQGQQHAWQNAYAREDDATSNSSPRSDTYVVFQLEIPLLIHSYLRTVTQEDWRTPMTTPPLPSSEMGDVDVENLTLDA